MFFKTLSTTQYSAPGIGINRIPCIDIFKRININFDKSSSRSYDYYDLMPGDTPDIVSTKAYNGNPYWYWAILMFNGVINPFTDFYRDPRTVVQNAESRYRTMGSFFFDDESVVFSSFDKTRDLRAGDIIIKINSDGTLPDPYTTTVVSAQLVYVNKSKREMRFIIDAENGTFAEGDAFAVIDKDGDSYTVAYKSKILKRHDKVTKGVSAIKDPDGKTVPDTTKSNVKVFSSLLDYKNAKLNDGLFGSYLGADASGNWDSEEETGYRAMNIEDTILEENENFGKLKIPEARLLQPLLTTMQRILKKPPTENKEIVKPS
jgi:hypothetical protein